MFVGLLNILNLTLAGKIPAVILFPVYNVGAFLQPCLDSLMTQTHQNLEILLIDDGSTDATCAVVEGLMAEDARIRLLRNEHNCGVAVTRNRGLDICRGAYVALLDCDFRKPSLHKIFEVPVEKEKNLCTYLLQDETDSAPYLLESKKYGIWLGLCHNSGRSITRLLNNGRLPALIKQLSQRVDYILLDTPPMLAAADTETLAAMVDTTLLVVRADFMPVSAVNEGLDRLRKSAPEVCGFVLNNHRTTIL